MRRLFEPSLNEELKQVTAFSPGDVGGSNMHRGLACMGRFVLFVVPVAAFSLSTYFSHMHLAFYALMAFTAFYIYAVVRCMLRRQYRRAMCFLLPLVFQFLIAGGPVGRWLDETGFKAKVAMADDYGRNCRIESDSSAKVPVHLCETIVYSDTDLLAVVYDPSDGLANSGNCHALEDRVPEVERAHFPWLGVTQETPFVCRHISGHYFSVKGPD